MSAPSAAAAAAQAAAEAAGRALTIESWTLYAFGVSVTILRTYARMRNGGISNLRATDYLVWVAVAFYSAQGALAHTVGNVAHGLANNGMTDAQRAALSPDNPEYGLRVLGSKIQVAGWTTYSALIWFLKLSVLAFYTQLTEGLGRPYRIRIYVGYALVMSTYVATIMTVLLECLPFHKYWQIFPDPGNVCQAAVSRPIIWVSFAANITTDLYLISIPLPMLWGSTLKTAKKIGATIALGSGVFVVVCAMIKSISIIVDPENGAQVAAQWGTREAFVAVVTTNLPMLFPLFKSLLKPCFGSTFLRSSKKEYKVESGFQTIGGGGTGGSSSRNNRGAPGRSTIAGDLTTFNESEERIVDAVKMHDMKPNQIVVSNQIDIINEDQKSQKSQKIEQFAPRAPSSW